MRPVRLNGALVNRPEEIIEAMRGLRARGFVVGTVGNASVRIADGLRITPSRRDYDAMGPEDLVDVDGRGRVLHGGHRPSRELWLHLAVYGARPDVCAIVHTHSPYATAWSFLGEPISPQTEEMSYYGIGRVGVAPAAPAGSPELAAAVAGSLGTAGAVLLHGHGVVAVGADLATAVTAAEAVEHQAHVGWLLRGAPAPLAWDGDVHTGEGGLTWRD
ncbi:3-oxo-tetronate 4-phosphate decarboxylase [Capillimicrobium parvum]|uniref:3-oxo-tetronate 4-phosphate decarboxylase n=1 Tax=Capillimicrobium parvum TaxID=2884022 RepID=A0A9E7C0L4_9ACTN|nr:3-oxo-tetronate 4-phosphate decarboxylase [Capillimicrobium parvum]